MIRHNATSSKRGGAPVALRVLPLRDASPLGVLCRVVDMRVPPVLGELRVRKWHLRATEDPQRVLSLRVTRAAPSAPPTCRHDRCYPSSVSGAETIGEYHRWRAASGTGDAEGGDPLGLFGAGKCHLPIGCLPSTAKFACPELAEKSQWGGVPQRQDPFPESHAVPLRTRHDLTNHEARGLRSEAERAPTDGTSEARC